MGWLKLAIGCAVVVGLYWFVADVVPALIAQ